MASSLDKIGPPPSSPTIGSLQHLVLRRHRIAFLACCVLLAFTSIYTVFALGFDSPTYKDAAPPGVRPVTVHTGYNGRVRSLIPPKIWQIMLPKGGKTANLYNIDPDQLKETTTWLAKNVDYQYHLVGPRTADEFVETNFASNERLLNAYHNLTNLGMKSDLLRYLILSVEGGVYSDIDTTAIRPVDAWIPRYLRDRIRLVVGIEFDKLDGPNWADIPHDLQFCQWTIAAAPGHPVFTRMVDRILDSLDELSEKHGVPVSEITPGSFEVMNSTGPAAWTDVVFETLQGFNSSLNETKDLSPMDELKVFGDVLVLTIDGFGMGQIHSGSTNDGSIPADALVKHQFWGSWREPEKHDEEQKKEEHKEEDHKEDKEEEHKEEENKEEEHKDEAVEKTSEDTEKEKQEEEARKLAEEAQRMQEAQRLEEEAKKLKDGAEKLAEAAQKQKAEAMKNMEETDQQDQHDHDHHDHSHDDQEHDHDDEQHGAPAEPSPAEEEPDHEDDEHFREEETLVVDTSAPPTAPGSKERAEEKLDPGEVLAVDTGTPPWPGQEWAP